MATEFKILRGNKNTLIDENGVVLIHESKLVNGYWYLTNDTAEVYVCLPDPVTGDLALFKINEGSSDADWTEIETDLEELKSRVTALEEEQHVITYAYREGFPPVGEEGKLYVAVNEGKSYVWFNAEYLVVSSDSEDPYMICGGDATEE